MVTFVLFSESKNFKGIPDDKEKKELRFAGSRESENVIPILTFLQSMFLGIIGIRKSCWLIVILLMVSFPAIVTTRNSTPGKVSPLDPFNPEVTCNL